MEDPMAQYEEAATTVIDSIANSGLTESTKATIESILGLTGLEDIKVENYQGGTVSDGTIIAEVGKDVHLTQDPGAPVVIMSADSAGADVTFGADSKVEALVLGGGNDNITFQGDKGVTVETGGGNDSITTADGSDTIAVTGGGNVTVNTGEGNDKVILQGDGTAHISSGAGDSTYLLQTDAASATINAGDGFDHLVVGEDRAAHIFDVDSKTGTTVMHSDNTVTMTGVQVVGFDKNGDGQITSADNISILAENANDSLIGKLYKIALGREAIDGADGWGHSTLGGINWWMNQFEKGQTDGTTEHLVRSFLNCDEFHDKYDNMSNADYVNTLFANLGVNDANLAADYLGQLDTGVMDRAQVAWALAESEAATQIMGIDGSNYVVDSF